MSSGGVSAVEWDPLEKSEGASEAQMPVKFRRGDRLRERLAEAVEAWKASAVSSRLPTQRAAPLSPAC